MMRPIRPLALTPTDRARRAPTYTLRLAALRRRRSTARIRPPPARGSTHQVATAWTPAELASPACPRSGGGRRLLPTAAGAAAGQRFSAACCCPSHRVCGPAPA